MNIQRIRNLTTGILHTEMSDIYQDIEYLIGEKGIITHMIPNAVTALMPYLREKIKDQRFFDDRYDPYHEGDFELPAMNTEEQAEFWTRYKELPHPFFK